MGTPMRLEAKEARAIWDEFESQLTDEMVSRVCLAGSLRRERPIVSDVDCVVKPVTTAEGKMPLHTLIMSIVDPQVPQWILDREATYKRPGQKFQCVRDIYPLGDAPQNVVRFFLHGVQIDLYESVNDWDFWPQVLVRTGPARRSPYWEGDTKAMQNPALAIRAQRCGLAMAMGPDGLVLKDERQIHAWAKVHEDGKHVGWESEQEFFYALGLPFCPPSQRDEPGWIGLCYSGQVVEPGHAWDKELGVYKEYGL